MKIQKRTPQSLSLSFQDNRFVTLKMVGGNSVVEERAAARSVLPGMLAKARIGSPNSFAGIIKDLSITDDNSK